MTHSDEDGALEIRHLLWGIWFAIVGCIIAAVWTSPMHMKQRQATTGDRWVATAMVLFCALVVSMIVVYWDD